VPYEQVKKSNRSLGVKGKENEGIGLKTKKTAREFLDSPF